VRIESIDQFTKVQRSLASQAKKNKNVALVCCGPGCLANGAAKILKTFRKELDGTGAEAKVQPLLKGAGCHGLCSAGPLVILEPKGLFYTKVKPSHVPKIIKESILGNKVIKDLLYKEPGNGKTYKSHKEIPFYKNQVRVSMRNLGKIDPEDIEDALAHGAYGGLVKALDRMSPDEVLTAVEESGLRGRGGGGFGTGRKWRSCKRAPGDRRFVVCNGDEGDPGAFKDRAIMEGDPHSVLEGMALGAYAIGSSEGYIYVREEYPLAVERLTKAIADARQRGFLGENILGSGFDFDVKINRGAGAFVCGESSALMLSIAGHVGEPRAKYIHSTEKGLFDLPTVLNNVETWADVGAIVEKGAGWFAGMGTEKSKGTKCFSIVGKVHNTGLIELPMGMSLRDVVFGIGGGVPEGGKFKAVQTGGPSGGCVPEHLLDLPVDYEKLTEAGSMMGSGGMIVMDERTCMVDVARYFLMFLLDESCGKCVPCREGLRQLLAIYDRILDGKGKPTDLATIERLSAGMQVASLCELGKSAPNPVLSTIRYFREEYEAHIEGDRCPAGICPTLTRFFIDEDACDGCHACFAVCPADAITGEANHLHTLHLDKCTSCGACFDVCPKDAVGFKGRSD
jgi:NADH-quinone oxidoreductase subunit F